MLDTEDFGSAQQIALKARARLLWRLVCDNPRYAYFGRVVALEAFDGDPVSDVTALARLQGATVCWAVPDEASSDFCKAVKMEGLVTDRHEMMAGDAEAYSICKGFAAKPLPADLKLLLLDGETPANIVADVAAVSLDCGLLPTSGATMRGLTIPGICIAALDKDDRVAATASAYLMHPAGSPRSGETFWGMLATRTDRQGQGLALALGARALVHMWETHGSRRFTTGVRADNGSSKAVCNKLGVRANGYCTIGCIDPKLFGGDKITK